jgi:ribonuclease BN (tRNA processing enzyme)
MVLAGGEHRTALQAALAANQAKIKELLLAMGADPTF